MGKREIGNETFYTVPEASKLLGGAHVATVRRLYRQKKLAGYKLRDIFISASSIKAFLGVDSLEQIPQ